MITSIKKRDGRTAYFDINKIASAMNKAFGATTGPKDNATCLALAGEVLHLLEAEGVDIPTVEQIQDKVESVLISHGYVRTAKATSFTELKGQE